MCYSPLFFDGKIQEIEIPAYAFGVEKDFSSPSLNPDVVYFFFLEEAKRVRFDTCNRRPPMQLYLSLWQTCGQSLIAYNNIHPHDADPEWCRNQSSNNAIVEAELLPGIYYLVLDVPNLSSSKTYTITKTEF